MRCPLLSAVACADSILCRFCAMLTAGLVNSACDYAVIVERSLALRRMRGLDRHRL